VSVVGDPLTRSLASEAGIPTYPTVDDARKADPGAPATSPEIHHAAIHVVRGPLSDETVPVLAAASTADLDAETRAVPVVRPTPAPRPRRTPKQRARRIPLAVILGVAAVLVVASVVAAAVVLPAATITIVPRTQAVGPAPDVFTVSDTERIQGTVTDTATVTATGSYDIVAAAAGRVTFFNFNFFDVQVPAESLVATGQEEGDQAYATDEAIAVPAGTFDPLQGGITAGEASVNVTAAATGPDGNVEAGAIDTVLDPNLAGQLRGFPSITEPLVTNVEPTAGGVDEEGVEITEEDVEAASNALVEALRTAAGEAVAESESLVFADQAEPAEPEIDGLDDLIGTRDTETVEIQGSLSYDRVTAEPAAVEATAIDRFGADASLVPAGWQLIEDSARVELGEILRAGEGLSVGVTVSGRLAPLIERGAVLERAIGRSAVDATAALADIGSATVDLWPFWVGTVPDSDWRITLEVAAP
jgi:hypothetical protein